MEETKEKGKEVTVYETLKKTKAEAQFYREQLEMIAADARKTRGRRLAESALTFWDAMKKHRPKDTQ